MIRSCAIWRSKKPALIEAEDRGPADFDWLDRDSVVEIHEQSIDDYGGDGGILSEGLLESAINRPKHRWIYDEEPLSAADMAATYAVGLARNHAFVDGNKRTAFMAMTVFLNLNGWSLHVRQRNARRTVEKVSTGKIDEKKLAKWILKHVRPLEVEEELELLDDEEEEDLDHHQE